MEVKDKVASFIEVTNEEEARLNLTALYRLLAHFGMDDTIYTHASARVPGENAFLINPFGYMFDEITPDSLVKMPIRDLEDIGGANAAGYVIHSAILAARPDVNCVVHTHTRAGVALSCLEDGLLPINQFAIEFAGRMGYHDYEGVAFNLDEGPRLDADIQGKLGLVLRNHGLLTVGQTIPAAFYLMYYLEQTCRVQMDVLATGRPFVTPSAELIAQTERQYTSSFDPPRAGHRMWPAMLRLLDRASPGWRG
ncbi:class II aldolase/adducin family protein [Zavarzinia sp.]|uniref:class II aldolase/adducin family protein n=1 Tax=Zavarzinia sp. TaxID=2027920 RepID=UPI003BB49534|nr:class II aldolase/adducin family protein [Zavarzinia sp.]